MLNAPNPIDGKCVLITGATSGIGLEAALALARMGARIVITGRNPARIDAALASLRERAGVNAGALCADFASLAAVRKLAADFKARHGRLDVLINNAGSVNATRTLTEDGFETTFAVNHLAPFLLTNLLLDRLVRSAPARVVNVASVAHTRGDMDFDDPGFKHGYRILRAYSRSKLANVLFTRALATRLADKGVTVNVLHPGTIATGIWAHGAPAGWKRALFTAVITPMRLTMLSAERGAQTIVYAATSPDLEGKTGLYLEKNRPKPPAPLALDDALTERLWRESARLVQLNEQRH
jgi:NAD(P)-dependent dehydrogenase (short-subunit alcohol dehydrogenase family)